MAREWQLKLARLGWATENAGRILSFLAPNGILLANSDEKMWTASFLFASLIWGSVGFGYFVYGKKQSCWPAMAGGLLMMAISYFAGTAWLMSLISLALILAVYFLVKHGY